MPIKKCQTRTKHLVPRHPMKTILIRHEGRGNWTERERERERELKRKRNE